MSASSPALRAPDKELIATMPVFVSLVRSAVCIPATPEEIAAALAELKKQPCLGFDTESKPTFHKGEVSDGPHLVQFATAQRAWLFQVRSQAARVAIADVLLDASIVKAGFGLANDTSQLAHKFSISPQNLIDLDSDFRRLGYRNAVGAKGAIAILFKQRFVKSKRISTSNWSLAQLNDQQVLYAANDAYAAIRVYEALRTLSL
ncbi:MAG TPA: 3'-5' exonuclease [Rhodocyclaceae bacterium]|nr:3'-5' exonuclease [Rhodocyclaceae bacterium]